MGFDIKNLFERKITMKKTLAKILALALCAVLLVTGTVFVTLAYLQSSTGVVRNTFSSSNITITLDEYQVDENGAVRKLTGKDESGKPTYVDYGPGEKWKRVMQQEQDYRLVPGRTYVKDPTVHIKSGSETCYIFIAIKNTMFPADNTYEDASTDGGKDGAEKKGTIAAQLLANGWEATGLTIKTQDASVLEALDSDLPGEYTVYVFNQMNATNVANRNIDSTPDYVVNVRENTTKEYFDLVIFENLTIKSDLNDEIVTADKVINVIAFAVQTEGFENSEDVDVGAGVYGYTLAWNTTYGGGGLA
jgi:hypothetical protein